MTTAIFMETETVFQYDLVKNEITFYDNFLYISANVFLEK